MTNHVTIADFFLYIHTYDVVSVWTDDEKSNKFVHYFRWYLFIDNSFLIGLNKFKLYPQFQKLINNLEDMR